MWCISATAAPLPCWPPASASRPTARRLTSCAAGSKRSGHRSRQLRGCAHRADRCRAVQARSTPPQPLTILDKRPKPPLSRDTSTRRGNQRQHSRLRALPRQPKIVAGLQPHPENRGTTPAISRRIARSGLMPALPFRTRERATRDIARRSAPRSQQIHWIKDHCLDRLPRMRMVMNHARPQ